MQAFPEFHVWLLTGSQHLYGPETLEQVARHSQQIVAALNDAALAVRIMYKPVLTTPEEIAGICRDANSDATCVGVIAWMHTFSPARNWIAGLSALQKPMLHLHTQFNRDIPWSEIDMDFMNLNQAAHGDREFGFMVSRMRRNRKVVVGHWSETDVQARIDAWMRAASAWSDSQTMRLVRFGDNMRSVAVTEGDKVEAQMRFGYQVHGYGVGDLVELTRAVNDDEINSLIDVYQCELCHRL